MSNKITFVRTIVRIVPFLLAPLSVEATDYYVAKKDPDADDGNAGTSVSRPFRTIQRAADIARAGDNVYIREGVYRETVTPANSGTWNTPITFTTYNGEDVTISGTERIRGWTPHNGSVYKASGVNAFQTTRNQAEQVFVDGVMVNRAQFPNTGLDQLDRSWGTITQVSNGDREYTIHGDGISGSWKGGVAHVWMKKWWHNMAGMITASGTGWVTFAVGHEELNARKPAVGDRFYLIGGDLAHLDANGEWYRDSSTKVLYIRTPGGDDPSTHVVEFKTREYAFDLNRKSNITIRGLKLFAATITTDTEGDFDGYGTESSVRQFFWEEDIARTRRVVIDQVHVQYPSHFELLDEFPYLQRTNNTGIVLSGGYHELTNSTIEYCAGNGVSVYGERNRVVNNVIHDVGYKGSESGAISTGFQNVTSREHEFAWNTVYRAGQGLIKFRALTKGRIHHNVVHDAVLITDDMGALYTWGVDKQGTRIDHNVIYNNRGLHADAMGIYLDGWSKNAVVDHNLVYETDVPLNFNAGYGHEIYNNTFSGGAVGNCCPQENSGVTFVNNFFVGTFNQAGTSVSNNILMSDYGEGGFVNPGQGNFQLNGSDARGVDDGAQVTSRLLGISITSDTRGNAPDVGAFEYGVSAWQAGANTDSPVDLPDYNEPPPFPPCYEGTGLRGRYYNGPAFNTFGYDRIDANIAHTFGAGGPPDPIGATNYSIIWAGTIKARYSEAYTFYADTDDGVRLWVDGKMIIDDWFGKNGESISSTIHLRSEETYSIKMAYYNGAGEGKAFLYWESASQNKKIVPQCVLFPAEGDVAVPEVPKGLYEAECATSAGTVTIYDDAPASGGKAVGYIDAVGDGVIFEGVPAGDSLEIRYANGMPAGQTLALYIDGSKHSDINFPATGSWSVYETVMVGAGIRDGIEVKLLYEASSGPVNLDYILPVGASYDPVTACGGGGSRPGGEYEAEDATQLGTTVIYDDVDAAGGRAVGYIDAEGDGVEWEQVREATLIDIRYSNGAGTTQTLSLIVDGSPARSIDFAPTAGWDDWQVATVNISVPQGARLRLVSGGGTVNLDNISIPGEPPLTLPREPERRIKLYRTHPGTAPPRRAVHFKHYRTRSGNGNYRLWGPDGRVVGSVRRPVAAGVYLLQSMEMP